MSSQCFQMFSNKYTLSKHQCKEPRYFTYPCKDCDIEFLDKKLLLDHNRIIHNCNLITVRVTKQTNV